MNKSWATPASGIGDRMGTDEGRSSSEAPYSSAKQRFSSVSPSGMASQSGGTTSMRQGDGSLIP